MSFAQHRDRVPAVLRAFDLATLETVVVELRREQIIKRVLSAQLNSVQPTELNVKLTTTGLNFLGDRQIMKTLLNDFGRQLREICDHWLEDVTSAVESDYNNAGQFHVTLKMPRSASERTQMEDTILRHLSVEGIGQLELAQKQLRYPERVLQCADLLDAVSCDSGKDSEQGKEAVIAKRKQLRKNAELWPLVLAGWSAAVLRDVGTFLLQERERVVQSEIAYHNSLKGKANSP